MRDAAQDCLILLVLFLVGGIGAAQSAASDPSSPQGTQARGYWVDPATGLMWAAKDNGRDVNWHQAVAYCQKLRLGGNADWRLASIDELVNIYDLRAEAPGRDPRGPTTWHVKGNLLVTGLEWSRTQKLDDRGRPSGLAWHFNFDNGGRFYEDATRFSGSNVKDSRRALCVRGPAK